LFFAYLFQRGYKALRDSSIKSFIEIPVEGEKIAFRQEHDCHGSLVSFRVQDADKRWAESAIARKLYAVCKLKVDRLLNRFPRNDSVNDLVAGRTRFAQFARFATDWGSRGRR